MAHKLIRYQEAGHLHFVTFSCYHRLPFLAADETRDLLERSLETMRLRYDFFVTAYVIMPEHVHLLISEPKHCRLAKAIQALKLSVCVQSAQRPFWQRRYYDFNVYTPGKVREKRRYIHRNRVLRGLVEEPENWKWSSFCHWRTGEVGIVEIESNWTARKREESGIRLEPPAGTS